MNEKINTELELKLEKALQLHNAGHLSQAQSIYEDILKIKPDHFDALQLFGALASQTKQLDKSYKLLTLAIEIDGTNPYVFNNRGTVQIQLRQFTNAVEDYNKAIELKNDYAEAYFNKAIALKELNLKNEALSSFNKSIEFNNKYIAAYFNRGVLLREMDLIEQALSSYKEAIKYNSKYAEAYYNCANIYLDTERLNEALDYYSYAIYNKKNYAQAYNNRGNVLRKLNRNKEAIKEYKEAIKYKSDYIEAQFNLGLTLRKDGKLKDAEVLFNNLINIKNHYSEAYLNRGLIKDELGKTDQAINDFNNAIKINPNLEEAYFSRGVLLGRIDMISEALTDFNKLIYLNKNSAEGYNNRGVILSRMKKLESAIEDFNKAIELNKNYVEALNNRGNVLNELKNIESAIEDFKKAIEINPQYANAYSNLGNSYKELKKPNDALMSYDKAIEINPKLVEAYYNKGILLNELKEIPKALNYLEKVYRLSPEFKYLIGDIQLAEMQICKWDNYNKNIEKIIEGIKKNKKITPAFPVLSFTDSLEIQRRATELWINDKFPFNPVLGDIPKRVIKNKIRIGYYSADFREHPVSYLTAELFEQHDKSKFEIIAFYFGPETEDLMHKRLRSSFEKFIKVSQKSDKEIALLSREMEIDIAVDLTGITAECRIGIFSFRAAPIQISYIGYLGTTGAEYIDYLVADEIIVPSESKKFYSEKIIYLPCYQVNDSKRKISNKVYNRSELNIPENSFVFCCLNNNYKINPNTFSSWMRILTKVTDSVMVLYVSNDFARENLVKEALIRGVEASRLIFCEVIERSEYLARYKVMDLFLDTSPYNAGTTASDALWAGLPVLTHMGQSFASRVAASLLTAVGLQELITQSQEEYERIAIELAQNKDQLLAIRDKLFQNKKTSILFDARKFANSLEEKYISLIRK